MRESKPQKLKLPGSFWLGVLGFATIAYLNGMKTIPETIAYMVAIFCWTIPHVHQAMKREEQSK